MPREFQILSILLPSPNAYSPGLAADPTYLLGSKLQPPPPAPVQPCEGFGGRSWPLPRRCLIGPAVQGWSSCRLFEDENDARTETGRWPPTRSWPVAGGLAHRRRRLFQRWSAKLPNCFPNKDNFFSG